MLNSYKELSKRYIKKNKKRTILTLIGIILSLTLISTIGLFMKSTEISQIEQSKYDAGYSAHITFHKINDDLVSKVSNNPNIKQYGFFNIGKEFVINGISFIPTEVDENAAQIMSYGLKEGRMPVNNNEICVEEWITVYFNKKLDIGSSITLQDKTYKIVGFLNSQPEQQVQKISNIITLGQKQEDSQLLVEIRSGENFKSTLKTLQTLTSKENQSENSALIRMEELGTDKALTVASWIVIAIVIFSTIIVIYNAFQINLVDRVKQFGLLRSIGATKKQIRSLVFREATLLCIIAVPIGLILSVAAIYCLQFLLNALMNEQNTLSIVQIDISVLIISTILTVISVYISSLLPAYHVGNLSPLVAINSLTIIKKENLKANKNKLLSKFLNFKARMALKNVWRNPKRCTVMILSIVVSATLFITFTTLMQEVIDLRGTSTEYQNIELEVDVQNIEDNKEIIKDIQKIDNIKKIYLEYPSISGTINVPDDKKLKSAGNIYTSQVVNGEINDTLSANIVFYNQTAIDTAKKYIKKGKIDTLEDGVILVTNGTARDLDTKKRYNGKITNYDVGDKITITDWNGNDYTVTVVATIEQNLFQRDETNNTLMLFSTNSVRENITGVNAQFTKIGLDLQNPELSMKTNEDIINILYKYPECSVINYFDLNRMQKNSILLIKILVYGFIFVISLISSLNIINTVTMNITIRRKELSVLKSIGMSQTDLKKMIMYEGVFYGLIGGVIGVAAGCGFTYAIYDVLTEIIGLQWKFAFKLSIITVAVAILISFLSALLPLKKIEKYNIIDIIREE